ncbi:hypothetical protein OHB12_04710 [Nocardia sp. NBC_01730]|uniref:hypothetical protein n=1 Tax=Nocardia sp. NBC_01730 TaxID=2975998 RepID=UPI002E130585|nr:hypothetical protein OHB12_04710 [Nocardia sp. NBC_01730]
MKLPRTQRIAALVVLACAPAIAASLLGCGTDNTGHNVEPNSTLTAITPTRLGWQPFQGVDLPVAEQGPRHSDGAVATGFDHSPAGAALAAIHATVRMSIASDTQWTAVGQRMLAPGPSRDTWATARAQISITAPITSGAPKVLGYLIPRYSPDATDVAIYTIHPDNSVTCNSTHVLWQGDDWHLLLPEHLTAGPVTAIAAPPADVVALTPR